MNCGQLHLKPTSATHATLGSESYCPGVEPLSASAELNDEHLSVTWTIRYEPLDGSERRTETLTFEGDLVDGEEAADAGSGGS